MAEQFNIARSWKITADKIYSKDNNNLTLESSGNIILNASGNVGIGTTSPGTPLQLEGTAPYITLKNSTAENTEGGCESKIIFEDHANVSLAQIQSSHDGTSNDTKGDLIFSTHSGSALIERLRIDSAGYLGIGTTSPGELLHVKSGGVTKIHCETSSTGSAYFKINSFMHSGYGVGVSGTNFEIFDFAPSCMFEP